MLENTSTQFKTVWFFISRLFILAGMVLFFSSLSYVLGALMSNVMFGVDVINDPTVFSSFDYNPKALNALKLLQVIITIGGMIVPAWFFPRAIDRQSALFLKLTGKINVYHLLCAIGITLLSAPMVSWLIEMNARLQLPASLAGLEAKLKASEEAAAELTKAFVASASISDLFINLIVVAIVPAIAEELLFRGALQNFFTLCFKNVHVAVLLSAALFSAFHGQIYGFMPRWVLGILLGYLFAYSGSIWPGVLAHFLNNALSLLASYFALEDSSLSFLQEDYQFPIYLLIISVFACTLLVYYLYKTQPKLESIDAEQLD
jgi:membrane protease YdiL (CAAX protease family)